MLYDSGFQTFFVAIWERLLNLRHTSTTNLIKTHTVKVLFIMKQQKEICIIWCVDLLIHYLVESWKNL